MSEFDITKFDSGASYLVSHSSYRQYIEVAKDLGRHGDIYDPNGNLFCSPKDEIDQAIKNSNGDIHKLEVELGLDKGVLGDGSIQRVDINNPLEHNIREATGYESGANCYFNTPRDENGHLPTIVFCKETNGKGESWTAHDSAEHEIVVVDRTDPNELAELNGKNATNHGDIHAPNLDGYAHTTSGGTYEGILDQVSNAPEHVTHFIITGWEKGIPGRLLTVQNNEAYPPFQSINPKMTDKY